MRKNHRSEFVALFTKIQELCSKFIEYDIRFVPRSANIAAHLYAKQASPDRPRCIWLNKAPAFLSACIRYDCKFSSVESKKKEKMR